MSTENWSVVEVDPNTLRQNVQEMMKVILEQEKDNNIAMDQSGTKFGNNQLQDGTWFLPGSFGNDVKIIRKIDAVEDTPIIVLGVSTDNSFAEDKSAKDVESLKTRAKQIFATYDFVDVIVNGKKYDRENGLKTVETDAFPIVFPQNNVYEGFGVNAGQTTLVCYAWVLVLKLGKGQHTIELHAYHPANKELGAREFNQDVEYQINAPTVNTI
jgi:hypothetical protein